MPHWDGAHFISSTHGAVATRDIREVANRQAVAYSASRISAGWADLGGVAMSADLTTLFDAFDRGTLSRRQLLQALGLAVAVRPAAAFAQGQCGGARAGTPGCETTPAKLPFEPTGWKTVLLD